MPSGFFVTGGTLRRGTPSYVERRADQELLEALDAGEYCYVLTSRQMGKSSLMVRTAHRLREAGRRAVVIDLTALGQSVTPEQWYGSMLGLLGEQLDCEELLMQHWASRPHEGPLRRWMGALRKVLDDRPVVLFVDEIDAVRSLPFATDEFFAAIRECYNRRSSDASYEGLTFCLLGVATPSDLIQDTRTTPFNIGRRIELTDFSPAEAGPLSEGLRTDSHHGDTESHGEDRGRERRRDGESSGTPAHPHTQGSRRAIGPSDGTTPAHRLLNRVLYWTGGHPYLTQRLCAAVTERLADGSVKSAIRNPQSAIDRVCRELFFGERDLERDDNLRFVRDRLLRGSADRASLLDAYARVRRGARGTLAEGDPLLDELRLSGIVRDAKPAPGSRWRRVLGMARPGAPAVRNRIYERVFDERWIRAHMPDAELQRQRAAYRRGIARASTMAGAVVLVMLGLTGVAVDRADAARRAQTSADGLVLKLSRSLDTQRSLNRQLTAALESAQVARGRADRSAAAATAARADETRQKQAAVRAEHAAETQRGLAERRRLLADARRKDAEQARADAVRERAIAQTRLSRSHVVDAIREADQGDGMGALAPLAEALRLDAGRPERAAMHRLRLAALLDPLPRIVQGWFEPWDTVACQASPDGARFFTAGATGTLRLIDAESGSVLQEVRSKQEVAQAALSPDGRRAVVCAADQTARVWDLTTRRPVTPPLHTLPNVRFVEWRADGKCFAIAGDGGAGVWDATTGRLVCRVELPGAVSTRARFTPDGGRLVVTSMNFLAWVADAESGKLLTRLGPCYNTLDAEISPDGEQVLLAGSHGGGPDAYGAFLFDLNTGKRVQAFPGRGMGALASFSPDGRRVAAGDAREARVWDAASGAPLGPPLPHRSGVTCLRFSADGNRLLTAGPDGTARLWDAETGVQAAPPVRHSGRVLCAAFGAGERRLMVSGSDGTVRLWGLETAGAAGSPLPLGESLREKPVLLLNGRRILTVSRPAGSGDEAWRIRVWDAQSRRLLFPDRSEAPFGDFSLSLDEGRILVSRQGAARLWDVESGVPLSPPLAVRPDSRAIHLFADGRRFIEWLGNGSAVVRNARTGREVPWPGVPALASGPLTEDRVRYVAARFPGNRLRLWDMTPAASPRLLPWSAQLDSPVQRVWFAPDLKSMMSYTEGGVIRAWEVRSGRPLSPPLAGVTMSVWDPSTAVRFSRDGTRAFAHIQRPRVRRGLSDAFLFDLRAGGAPRLPEGFRRMPPTALGRLSPDGRYATTYGVSGTIRVWDARTGRIVSPLLHHREPVWEADFTPDSRALMTVRADGVVQLWDVRSGRRLGSPMAPSGDPSLRPGGPIHRAELSRDGRLLLTHGGPVHRAELSPDGRLLLTSDREGVARLWDARTGEPLMPAIRRGGRYAGFTPDGRALLLAGDDQVALRPLAAARLPVPDLLRLCVLLAGERADDHGGRVEVDPPVLREAWRAVRRSHAAAAPRRQSQSLARP